MSSVECRGDEDRLVECPHSEDREGCEADTVAGVVCGGSINTVRSFGEYLGLLIGLSLTFLVILVSGGMALMWERRIRRNRRKNSQKIELANSIYF